MKRYLYFIVTIVFLSLWSSCRKDFEFSPSTGNLTFSKDTVYLDTVFTNIGSSTYNLKVYNKSKNDIVIPTVKLAQGEASNYRLNVDGMAGKTFENVKILAKDSLFIFVETTVNIADFANNGQYLYTDQIEFDSNTNLQKVELVTLVQDAVFIYPNRDETSKIIETLTLNIDGETVETELQGRELLPDELTFTNEKPYVVYGFAAVPNNETLTIAAGARIHFHENSGLIVSQGASLQVNGTYSSNTESLENEVIFEGDRLEHDFENTPGQWGTIWLMEGSTNNLINYATIKNATIGILCDGNPTDNTKLQISNSQIYNSGNFGVLGRNTNVTGKNLVVNNSGLSSFAATFGGAYNLTHCTIANYWTNSASRQYPALLLNNHLTDDDTVYVTDLTEANFNNCIVYGNDTTEILLDEVEDAAVNFNFKFTNCLIRFQNSNTTTGNNYNFEDSSYYENNIFNQNPDFFNPNENKLIIGEKSAGINMALPTYASQVPLDILNVNRTSLPDIGAYQHIVFPVED
ncbi:MAG: hypothetical protein ACK5NB_13290 [Flavobacteriaceae bacterium]